MKQEKHHKHLTLEERRQIFRLLNAQTPVRRIAEILDRHASTIYREIKRNAYFEEDDHKMNGYYPVCAQELYQQRRQSRRLFCRYPELKEFVVEKLRAFWSPDQIAGYLRRVGTFGFYACMETIYRFIYSKEGRDLGLSRYLFNRRKNRRRMRSRKPRGSRIPEHHGIAFRPDIVDEREIIGHWEGDLMIFNREHGKMNLTSLIERKSRYMVLAKNDNRKPDAVIGRISETLSELPKSMRQTITFDRGFEFLSYPLLRRDLGMDSYFCDPQAPWQKGAVESNNNRIRRFLPREVDLNTITDRELKLISDLMNDTPRRCLGYRKPKDVFAKHLQLAA